MASQNHPLPQELASADAEAADVARYRESAGIRLRFVLWRSIGLLALIYIGNVLINIIDVSFHQGLQAFSQSSVISGVLFLNAFSTVSHQIPSIMLSLVGVVVLSMALTLTARIRYRQRMNSYRKQLEQFRKQKLKDFQKEVPGAQIDIDADTRAWVSDVLGREGIERMKKLDQIEEWFKYDELLVQWTALLIERRAFRRDLLNSILVSAGAVIIARVFLLLR